MRRTTSSTFTAVSSQAAIIGHAFGDLAQRGGTRVVGAVNTMSEAHDLVAAGDRLADPLLGAFRGADLVKLTYDLCRCPAVLAGPSGADRAAHGARQI